MKRKRQGRECPYMDTIDRTVLDFDYEKLCSVTLSRNNVYACLVCGKYFQGRGPKTPAFAHAVEYDHHLFIHLETEEVSCRNPKEIGIESYFSRYIVYLKIIKWRTLLWKI